MPLRSAIPCLSAALALAFGLASSSCSKTEPPGVEENESAAQQTSRTDPAESAPAPVEVDPGEATVADLPLAHLSPSSPAHEWSNVAQTDPGEWTQRYASVKTNADRLVVIGTKQASGPEYLAPLLKMALRNPSAEFRASAVQMAYILEGQDAVDVLSAATYDNDANVRAYATEMIRELPQVEARLETYRAILKNPNREVKEETIRELGNYSTKPAFEIMIEGLDDPDPAFRSLVMEELMPFVGMESQRTFQNSGQARIWWQQHKERYDDRMSYITE